MQYFILNMLLICVGLLGCQSPKTKEKSTTDITFYRAIEMDDRFANIDSTVVLFYDDPYGPDSLRYSRYYTQVSLQGVFTSKVLPDQLQAVYSKSEKRNQCRGEGKIWCYREGKIQQTLYFNNRCPDACCYLYFIKDGFFYYTSPQSTFISALQEARKQAKKPDSMVQDD